MKPFIADVHTHSVLSGHAFGTVRELAAEAAARNLKILGVTEHGSNSNYLHFLTVQCQRKGKRIINIVADIHIDYNLHFFQHINNSPACKSLVANIHLASRL